MTKIYRFRREIPFARPAAAIWPFVSDSARLWEFNGMAPYRFEERVDAQGRVRRFVRGKLGPFPARWEEDFGEWQENHRLFQVRNYQNGPIRHWEWACELIAEGEGCRLIVTGMAEPAGFLGFVSKHAGIFEAEFGKAPSACKPCLAVGRSPNPSCSPRAASPSDESPLAPYTKPIAPPANLPAPSFNPASMRSATVRPQRCAADLTEASRFPNQLHSDSSCWLGGGQQGCRSLIRKTCVIG